jgi:phosphotransferase system enzyme I (PtsI)
MKSREVRETVVLKGTAVSPGIVIGRAHVLRQHDAPIPKQTLEKRTLINAEIQRFRKALKESEKQLLAIKKKLSDQEGIEPLYIIDVHIMILNDRMLINRTIANIEEGVHAEWALRKTLDKYKEVFSKVDDDYLRERMTDVEYVGQRILRNLVGVQGERISGAGENVIIVARDL